MSTPGQAATRAPVPLHQTKQSEMIEDQTNKFFEMETINYSNCYQNHIVLIEFYKIVKLRARARSDVFIGQVNIFCALWLYVKLKHSLSCNKQILISIYEPFAYDRQVHL